MLDLDIAYPEFVPNQILTDGQLNQLRLHLEHEDRVTRLRLGGMGIICGLGARKLATSIEIDAGYGITSDGDLIELCPTTAYTHFRPYVDPDTDDEDQIRYLPWRAGSPTTQRDIIELITPAQMAVVAPELPPQGATPLTAAHLANSGAGSKVAGRVLVLYLEHEPEELKSCLVTSCDNKGRKINVNVRALLVTRDADLRTDTSCPPAPPFHRVPRMRPAAFANAAAVTAAFRTIVSANDTTVGTNIKTLFSAHASFLNLPQILDLAIPGPNALAGKLSVGAHIAQYQYDALHDFATAYNEAAAAVYALVKTCCPTGNFPRHLLLGVLDSSAPAGYRNVFAPAPLANVSYGEIDRVRDLFLRTYFMLQDLDLGGHPAEVIIKPSHTAAYPLGRRSRPFYVTAGAPWRPHARCTVDGDWPWMNPAVAISFTTDYAEATLLRIEGHVGKRVQPAYDAVVGRRRDGNAEFNVLRSYLDGGAAAENAERERMREKLKIDPAQLKDLRELFINWLSGGADLPAIHEFAQPYEIAQIAVGELSRNWVSLRKRRHLQCDTAALEHDYLQARNRIMCATGRALAILLRYQTDIGRLDPDDEKLTGPGLEASVEGAQLTLVRNLIASVLASPDQWRDPARVKIQLSALGKPEGADALRAALVVALQALRTQIERFSELLPRELADFDFERFAYLSRIAIAQSRAFWIWTRAIGLQIPSITPHPGEGEPYLHPGEDASIAADWLGLEGCLLAALAAIAAEYEAIRAADLSIFANLVTVDGLEHLAGVSKGGTFVLVSSDVTPDGTVLADLSLEGCLPCCCHAPDGVCLPPLALPDVRVVIVPSLREQHRMIKDGTFKLPVIDVNVMANDCDLNGPPPALRVGLVTATSDLGHGLELTSPGVVRYIAKGLVLPGTVDSFEYELAQTSACEGRTTGTVVIVFAAKPVTEGAIDGVVLDENNKPVATSTVTLVELGREVDPRDDGHFEFKQVPAGTYTLFARLRDGSITSEEQSVTVVAGETTENVRLIIRSVAAPQPKGRIFVTVKDQTGAVLPGVIVTVALEAEPPRFAPTGSSGVAAFTNLKEGRYAVIADMEGLVTARLDPPVVLPANQTVRVELTMQTAVITVPPRTIGTIATRRRVDPLTVGVEMRDALNERYAKFVNTFNRATRDPKVADSDPYKSGAAFLAKQLTDPGATDAEVTAQYKRTATALAAAVAAAPAAPDKAAYRTALAAVTGAYFDRVASATTGALAADQTAATKDAVTRMKNAGITTDAFKEQWQGAALKERTNLASADAIGALIA